jgi:hypothetical protein
LADVITWLHVKMTAFMGDGLDVGGRHVHKAVRQIRQGAGDRELLTDLRYIRISGIATR